MIVSAKENAMPMATHSAARYHPGARRLAAI